MTKKIRFFILILSTLIMAAAFTACGHNTLPEKTAEEELTIALQKFNEQMYIDLSGSYENGTNDYLDYYGSFDLNMHQGWLDTLENRYYYFHSMRFQDAEKGITVKDYITFTQMKMLVGNSLLNFSFNKDNVRNITKTKDMYSLEFVSVGAKYSFTTDLDLSGGYMHFYIDKNNNITKTIISSQYKIGSTDYNYTSVTSYSYKNDFTMDIPQIMPTSDSRYAKYQLDILGNKYEGTTLVEDVSLFDTQSEIADLPNAQVIMKKVTTQLNEDLVTMIIEYSTPQLVVGINTSMTKIEIRFSLSKNEFSSIKVNDGKRYVFKK